MKVQGELAASKKIVILVVDADQETQVSESISVQPRKETTLNASDADTRCIVRLSRSLPTVVELSTKYTRGVGSQISVQEAERRFKDLWRAEPTESRFLSRRKAFFEDTVIYPSKRNLSHEAAAEQLEVKR